MLRSPQPNAERTKDTWTGQKDGMKSKRWRVAGPEKANNEVSKFPHARLQEPQLRVNIREATKKGEKPGSCGREL